MLIGGIVALGFMLLAGRTADHLVEITFTTLVAYGSVLVAEHFRCSGVLATLTAGLNIGNCRSTAVISETGRLALETFWEYLALIANSLIFILIGAQEAEQHFGQLGWSVLVAITLVTVGRTVAIYPVCSLFARSWIDRGALSGNGASPQQRSFHEQISDDGKPDERSARSPRQRIGKWRIDRVAGAVDVLCAGGNKSRDGSAHRVEQGYHS